MKIKNIIGHLTTIVVHKYWVFIYCCRLGVPWRGIIHDISKFSWIEFSESAKYYQSGKKSPIPVIKKENGYSKAWQHHKGHNPHHYEYWTDNYDTGVSSIEMPEKYVREMVADWMAAGRTYNGKSFTVNDEIKWWNDYKDKKFIHPKTKERITEILNSLNHTKEDKK